MVNKAILIGNLGKDPELRYTASRVAVASFSLATSERFTDKNGQKQEKTEWHNIVAWNKTAELVNQYLKKGSKVYIEGKIQTRSYDDRDGNKKYKTEIVASQVTFLSGGQGGGAPRDGGGASMPQEPDMGPPQVEEPPPPMPSGSVDDDLPF